jgi:hypothetical protein
MKKIGNSAEAGSRGPPLKPQVDAGPLRPKNGQWADHLGRPLGA